MKTIAVVGLGYVGLGLATALSQKHKVIGYDINETRIKELRKHIDSNHLVEDNTLLSKNITYTHHLDDIKAANFYIVSVATPAYFYETPNLEPLISATKDVAR
ncbi:MAG: NAD-binding protein, partial [Legionellaceae bacterium]|nr:NAD-binding protein [Legionellaceae bacterium]